MACVYGIEQPCGECRMCKEEEKAIMKKKRFYTMMQKDDFVKAERKKGYQVKIGGEIYNAYRNKKTDKVYIVDPKTGNSVMEWICLEWAGTEQEVIEAVGKKFIEGKNFEKLKEARGERRYKTAKRVFKACKELEKLRKKIRKNEAEERKRVRNEKL